MKILLADPKSYIRYGLAVLMEEQPDIEVVGEAENSDELLKKLDHTQPDLILLGSEMPSKSLDVLLPEIRRSFPSLAIIVLSGGSFSPEIAMKAGANGFIRKGDLPDRVLKTVRQVINRNIQSRMDPQKNQIVI